jgi:hypothetical protein
VEASRRSGEDTGSGREERGRAGGVPGVSFVHFLCLSLFVDLLLVCFVPFSFLIGP